MGRQIQFNLIYDKSGNLYIDMFTVRQKIPKVRHKQATNQLF